MEFLSGILTVAIACFFCVIVCLRKKRSSKKVVYSSTPPYAEGVGSVYSDAWKGRTSSYIGSERKKNSKSRDSKKRHLVKNLHINETRRAPPNQSRPSFMSAPKFHPTDPVIDRHPSEDRKRARRILRDLGVQYSFESSNGGTSEEQSKEYLVAPSLGVQSTRRTSARQAHIASRENWKFDKSTSDKPMRVGRKANLKPKAMKLRVEAPLYSSIINGLYNKAIGEEEAEFSPSNYNHRESVTDSKPDEETTSENGNQSPRDKKTESPAVIRILPESPLKWRANPDVVEIGVKFPLKRDMNSENHHDERKNRDMKSEDQYDQSKKQRIIMETRKRQAVLQFNEAQKRSKRVNSEKNPFNSKRKLSPKGKEHARNVDSKKKKPSVLSLLRRTGPKSRIRSRKASRDDKEDRKRLKKGTTSATTSTDTKNLQNEKGSHPATTNISKQTPAPPTPNAEETTLRESGDQSNVFEQREKDPTRISAPSLNSANPFEQKPEDPLPTPPPLKNDSSVEAIESSRDMSNPIPSVGGNDILKRNPLSAVSTPSIDSVPTESLYTPIKNPIAVPQPEKKNSSDAISDLNKGNNSAGRHDAIKQQYTAHTGVPKDLERLGEPNPIEKHSAGSFAFNAATKSDSATNGSISGGFKFGEPSNEAASATTFAPSFGESSTIASKPAANPSVMGSLFTMGTSGGTSKRKSKPGRSRRK